MTSHNIVNPDNTEALQPQITKNQSTVHSIVGGVILWEQRCERQKAFSVVTQFTVSIGKRVAFREECHWSHACSLEEALACVGSNGILECRFLSENAHRTVLLVPGPLAAELGSRCWVARAVVVLVMVLVWPAAVPVAPSTSGRVHGEWQARWPLYGRLPHLWCQQQWKSSW
jgi:hypothetical protein